MNLLIPNLLVAALAGLGLYAVIARRHAVMVLIGAELLVNAGVLLLVTADLRHTDPEQQSLFTGQVGALFAITIAAAEIGLALAIVLLMFRTRGDSDLRGIDSLGEHHPGHPGDGSPVEPDAATADRPEARPDRQTVSGEAGA